MNLKEIYKKMDREMVEEFVNDGQEEHLTLDFITVRRADLKHPDDKKNFAKALSGFANSSGGIIVWGVEAKKNKEGIDCACGANEIQPLKQLTSRLNQLTGELVNRVVEGVIHKKIETSNDKGFVKTLIPESDIGPHMAKGGLDRYYKRSGDSFYRMEHFDIEDMFGRRKKPKLSLYVDIVRKGRMSGADGTKYTCHVYVGVKNTGRGVAKHVAIAAEVKEPYKFKDWQYHTGRRLDFQRLDRPGSDKVMYSLGANVVVHPGSSVAVLVVPFVIGETQQTIADVEVDAELMAEDMRTVEERAVISGEEIVEKIVPRMDS